MTRKRLIEIGEEFCNKNSDSLILIKTTRDQTLAYFKAFHVYVRFVSKIFLILLRFCLFVCCCFYFIFFPSLE